MRIAIVICAVIVLAAPFLVDRTALELALFHAVAWTPIVACVAGTA